MRAWSTRTQALAPNSAVAAALLSEVAAFALRALIDDAGLGLSRAKAKIRAAGIRFQIPEAADLPIRVAALLEAIYAAYGSGWDDVTGADHGGYVPLSEQDVRRSSRPLRLRWPSI